MGVSTELLLHSARLGVPRSLGAGPPLCSSRFLPRLPHPFGFAQGRLLRSLQGRASLRTTQPACSSRPVIPLAEVSVKFHWLSNTSPRFTGF
jgi:hypothetical protein